MSTYTSASLNFLRKKVLPFVLGVWVVSSGAPAVFQYALTALAPSANNVLVQWKSGSGLTVLELKENGNLRGSGTLALQGSISGATIYDTRLASGSGTAIVCIGTDGRLGKMTFSATGTLGTKACI